jgi:hypothetical protein
MRLFNPIQRMLFFMMVVSVLVSFECLVVQAQPGPSVSVSYDILPFQDFKDPIITSSELGTPVTLKDPQVQLQKLRASLSYPIVFSEGRTVLVNDLSYQLIRFKYHVLVHPLERLHSASYTLMLQHQLSQKWSIWALGTPSLASDLEAKISAEDFNWQAAAIIIRHFSERFSVGVGAAYSTQFGSAVPMPVLGFDWNNGKNMLAKAILPVSFEFWYRPSQYIDLGLLMSGDGNNFRGDPGTYHVPNPELRYTMLTIGPAARISLYNALKLDVEGGVIALHRFEFFDGDLEVSSYDLEPSYYVRVGLKYGY